MNIGRSVVTLGRPLGASLLLLALALAALAALGASWADLSSAADERDAKGELLERSVAASRRTAAPVGAAQAVVDPFVVADTATLAAGRLEARLRALSLAAGLSLRSSRAEAKTDEPGVDSGIGTRIEGQAVLEGGNEGLQAYLVALETGSPTVMVDDLSLETADAEPSGVVDAGAPRLRMTLTTTSFWRSAPRVAPGR